MTDYEVLGVTPWATSDEIKKAYKEKIKIYHPDRFSGNKEYAMEMTKRINTAYSRLKSVMPQTPCPALTRRDKVYGAKCKSETFVL